MITFLADYLTTMSRYIILLLIISGTLFGCSNKRLGYESEETEDGQVEDSTDADLCVPVIEVDSVIDREYEATKLSNNSGEFNNGKIYLHYPSSWEVVQQNTRATDRTTIAVQIMQKYINEYDFRPNINIIFSRDKHTETTYSLAKISFNQVKDSGLLTTLLGIKSCNISGCKGSVVEYIVDIENYKLHIFQYILKKSDNTIITITSTLDHDNLGYQRKIAQSIIDSITIY